jgi:hypothetical protein
VLDALSSHQARVGARAHVLDFRGPGDHVIDVAMGCRFAHGVT